MSNVSVPYLQPSLCGVAITADGRHAISITRGHASERDGQLLIWECASGRCINSIPIADFGSTPEGQANGVSGLFLTPDDRFLIAVLWYGQIWIWEMSTGSLMQWSTTAVGVVSVCGLSPDGRELIIGLWDGHVIVLTLPLSNEDLTNSKPAYRHLLSSPSEGRPRQIIFNPDGDRVIVPRTDGTICVSSLRGGLIRTLTGHEAGVNSVAIAPDGRRLVSGSDDKTIKVWDLFTGLLVLTMSGHQDEVIHVAVTSDGLCISAASGPVIMGIHLERYGTDPTLRLWSLDSGREITVLGKQPSVNMLGVTSDGRFAVSASGDLTDYSDNTVRVWDLHSMKMSAKFEGEAPFDYCVLASDSSTIVAGDQLAKIHFLRVEEHGIL